MQLSGRSFLFGFSGIQALSISYDTISSLCTLGGRKRVMEDVAILHLHLRMQDEVEPAEMYMWRGRAEIRRCKG